MSNTHTPCNEPSGEAWASGAKNGPDTSSGSIRYEGAKESRVPLPVVLVGFVLVAAAIYAARHFLG